MYSHYCPLILTAATDTMLTLLQLRKQQGGAAAAAAAAAASEVHGTGKAKGSVKVHEERWKRSSEAAANAAKHGGGAGVCYTLLYILYIHTTAACSYWNYMR
jgi:hypothetical protein